MASSTLSRTLDKHSGTCPQCERKTGVTLASDGRRMHMCPCCGWRSQQTREADRPRRRMNSADAPTLGGLILLWAGTGLVAIGPHYLLNALDPSLLDGRLLPYIVFMAAYFIVAAFVTPQYDAGNLGLGGTMIDNPLSYEDDWNRQQLKFAMFLAPGKLGGLALLGTLRHFGWLK